MVYNMSRARTVWMIRPWIEDFSAFDHFAQPLGFLEIAARLKKSGCDVHYIDALSIPCTNDVETDCSVASTSKSNLVLHKFHSEIIDKPSIFKTIPRHYRRFGWSGEYLRDQLATLPRPSAILITTGMTYWYAAVKGVLDVVADVAPGVPVAMGGVYAGIVPEHAARLSVVAHVFAGSVGDVFYSWLSAKAGISVSSRQRNEDIIPAWDLVQNLNFVALATSRGCTHRCAYCFASALSESWKGRSMSSLRNEIQVLVSRFGIREIALYDDDLGCPTPSGKTHFSDFLQMLANLDLPVRWHLPNALGIASVTSSIAQMMAATGFSQPRLSVNHLDRCLSKNGLDDRSLQMFSKAAAHLQNANYDPRTISAYLIAGLPGQTLDGLKRATDQLLRIGIKPYLAQYSPIPGTDSGDVRLKHLQSFVGSADLLLTNKILSVYHHDGWTGDQYQAFSAELKKMRES